MLFLYCIFSIFDAKICCWKSNFLAGVIPKGSIKRSLSLSLRNNDLEQYSRINDIVVTGLKIKPQSYAKAAVSSGRGDVFNEEDNQSVEQQLIKFLQSNEILVNE